MTRITDAILYYTLFDRLPSTALGATVTPLQADASAADYDVRYIG